MPTGLTLYAILIAGALVSIGGAYELGHLNGSHAASLACANQSAVAASAAVEQWQTAAKAQSAADAQQRSLDAMRAQATTAALADIQSRFAGLKLAIVKAPPKGTCALSPEWLQSFNGSAP